MIVLDGTNGISSPSETTGAITATSITGLTTPLSVGQGGTGTATPALVAGTNVTITGSFPNQTINASGGGGGLTNFTATETTATPNATVPVESLTALNASYTNIDVALVAKGTGATLAQIPDNTTAGGNKRGAGTTDWQKIRTSATQVASGLNATIGGGSRNIASGEYAIVAGGRDNRAYGTGYGGSCFVGGGTSNTAGDQTDCTVGGGTTNTASGNSSVVAGGNTNLALGYSAAICGGFQNTASGDFSSISGGVYGTTRGIAGMSSIAACNRFISGVSGVSQTSTLLMGRITTDATPVVLTSNTSAATTNNQIILPNNSAYYFKGSVISTVTGAGNGKAWVIEGAIKRGANAASTVFIGTPTVVSGFADVGAATWTIGLTVDTTNGGLSVTFTGQAATTIRTVCNIQTTEVTY